MWNNTKNIFDYLRDKNISLAKKEELINKKKTKLINEINKLTEEEIINYLFNSKIPKSVKKIICDEIDNLVNKNDEYSIEKLQKIKAYFNKINLSKEEYLYKDYCPNILKEIIIDKYYSGDILKHICDKSIPLKTKKLIIDVKLDSQCAIKLLNENLSLELIDYIIDNKINTETDIKNSLNIFNKIPNEIKEKIIIKKINTGNLIDILDTVSFGEELTQKIYKLKDKDITQYINNLKTTQILQTMNSYKISKQIVDRIIELRKQDIKEQIKKLDSYLIESYLLDAKTPDLVNIILEEKKKIVLKIISQTYYSRILLWLNNKYIPNEIKEYILLFQSKKVNKAIKHLTLYQAKSYYLSENSNLPKPVQEKIFESKKDLFIEEMKNYTEDELINMIKYRDYSHSIKKLMIEQGINQNNIFNLLSQLEHHLNIAQLTIKLKKDVFEKFLNNIDQKDIFRLSNIKINNKIKNMIIDSNKELISDRLKKIDQKELYSYLSDVNTLYSIKKIILENFGIYELNLQNCLELINSNNCELLISNYSNIKSFLNSVGIDFETFLQYGSGSKKYENWLIDIINIINNNKTLEFIRVKNYLFNNYYDKDNEKENMVYTISNFMELLENFSNNYELCLNLEKNNMSLSKEDKLNIAFLFNVKKVNGLSMPKTLEELNNFKLNLYDNYIKIINSSYVSIYELKQIFNDLIFCNADIILKNIGGTRSLKTLKKDNSNSTYICNLIDELMLYTTIIEKVNDTNNKEGLIKVLKYIFKDDLSNLTYIQNMFSQFRNKVTKLYELDSQINLTQLAKAREVDGVIDDKLSLKYGGEVFDFSDKNYVLYGHVLSSKENIEELLNGESSGTNNFISVSPISYMGQKYYYNISKVILAFDKIPNGSFVYSSISNMGSNYNINNNSSEVKEINRHQRGILETSAVTKNNSEALLYREGLKPCGLILPGGRIPNEVEMEYHTKYNLPFIITQELNISVENPKRVFSTTNDKVSVDTSSKELKDIINILNPNVVLNKETNEYTGREIAIFTDCHSMYEPTIAVLEDIRKRGIKEIYSLGDNVGIGPNPAEVFDLLDDYEVKSIAGNSEYYNILGTEPFSYFYPDKVRSQEWTAEKLGISRINRLKLYPASLDIIIGNKKIALCHFANDVRWDFGMNSTWTYQDNFTPGQSSKQFLYTNSDEAKQRIDNCIMSHKKGDKSIRGYLSSKNEPLFNGKRITDYDSVFQGHVHFEMIDKLNNTDIYTLRAIGMGYTDKNEDLACYYILKERKDGSFDIEKKLIDYNKNSLISNIHTCGIPEKEKILSFIKGK